MPFDTWQKVRMDIFKNNQDTMVIEFYHNGNLKWTEYPPDGDLYWDPTETEFGPKRSFELFSSSANPGKMIAFIDNVNAVYKKRVS